MKSLTPLVMKSLLACLALVLLAACGEQAAQQPGGVAAVPEPGPARALAAPEVDFPEAPMLPDDTMAALVRIKDPQATLERIAPWSTLVDPTMTAEELGGMLAMAGVNPADLSPGRNVSAFFWLPEGQGFDMPYAGIASVTEESAMRTMMPFSTEVGEYTVFARDPGGMTRAEPRGQALAGVNEAPVPGEAQVYVNMQGIMDRFGPMIRSQVTMMQSMMTMNTSGGADAEAQAAAARMGVGAMTAMLDGMEQIGGLTLGVDMDEQRADLSLVLSARPATALRELMDEPLIASPDQVEQVGRGGLFTFQYAFNDLRPYLDAYAAYMSALIQPEQAARVRELFDAVPAEALGTLHTAFRFDISDDLVMQYLGVAECEAPDVLMDYLRDNTESWFNEGPFHEMYRAMGIEMGIEPIEPGEVAGAEVLRYRLRLDVAEGAAEDMAQALSMFMSDGLIFEMANIDGTVVFSTGQPIDESVVSRMHNPEPVDWAFDDFEAGAWMVGEVNVAGYLRLIQSMMPGMDGMALEMPADLPPLSMAGYHQDGRGYYLLRTPREFVARLAE